MSDDDPRDNQDDKPDDAANSPAPQRPVSFKIDDADLRCRYANQIQVTHTPEEFVLDFLQLLPPQSMVTTRVATTPQAAKRMLRALQTNIHRYESTYGAIAEPQIVEDTPPDAVPN
ncbi:MAG: DUF3467 domain-containing protein [Acidobacteriota bacterium]